MIRIGVNQLRNFLEDCIERVCGVCPCDHCKRAQALLNTLDGISDGVLVLEHGKEETSTEEEAHAYADQFAIIDEKIKRQGVSLTESTPEGVEKQQHEIYRKAGYLAEYGEI